MLSGSFSDAHKQTPDIMALEDRTSFLQPHFVQFHICLARESAVEISAKALRNSLPPAFTINL